MSKRFIDTEIFNDPWFMDLSKDAKVLWIYAITNCNHAGILKVNEKLIEFQTKIKSFLTVSKDLANCLIRLNGSDYYLIPKFFGFQYPNYPEKTFRAADSAVNELRKFNLWDDENDTILYKNLTVSKDLPKSPSNSIGNSKDNKTKYAEFVKMKEAEYDQLITKHGETKTKKFIEVLDNYKGSKGKTYKSDYRAILSWVVEKCDNGQTTGSHPNYYSQQHEKGLNMTQTNEYHQHLVKLGWKKISAPGGTNWKKP